MKDGLDDFRDGLPPPIEGDVTLKVGFELMHDKTNNFVFAYREDFI